MPIYIGTIFYNVPQGNSLESNQSGFYLNQKILIPSISLLEIIMVCLIRVAYTRKYLSN